MNPSKTTLSSPKIVKYAQPFRNGIQPHSLNRVAIGYVISGLKRIYYGDTCHEIKQNEIFFLCAGNHYTEDIPNSHSEPFEQVIFYYTPDLLSTILSRLVQTYSINIKNDHACEKCRNTSHLIFETWSTLTNFFSSVDKYINDDMFSEDKSAELIKMTELIYLLFVKGNGCIKYKILSNMDLAKEQFEQTIYSHIFTDISIENLSRKCNKSLTTFKKEFKRYFFIPPHKWFLKQRLMHSRLLLISTDKSVAEIGIECNFPNTSHFIKLFKKEYSRTPAIYRNEKTQQSKKDVENKAN